MMKVVKGCMYTFSFLAAIYLVPQKFKIKTTIRIASHSSSGQLSNLQLYDHAESVDIS